MNLTFSPQGNRKDCLQSIHISNSTITINGAPYDLSQIPNGATLPNASEATGCEYILGSIENINGTLHLNILLPYFYDDQPHSVLFPDSITVTDGDVPLPPVVTEPPQPKPEDEGPEDAN